MEKRLNILHVLLHFSYQALAGIEFGFGVYMLVNRGYSASTAGLLMSLACGFSVLLSPFVSNFLDHSKKVTIFEMVIVESILVMTMFFLNSLFTSKALLLSMIFVIGGGFYSSMEPMINTYATHFIGNGLKVDYGKARSAGSFGYGFVCIVFGYLTTLFGYQIAILAGVGFAACICLTAIFIRKEYKKIAKKDDILEKEESVSFKDFIKNNAGFVLLCVFLMGLFLSYTGADNFTLLFVENVGGDTSDMGLILGFKAFIETVSIFLFSFFLRKIKLKTLLTVSAVSLVLKMALLYLSDSVFMLYVAQCLQFTSFAFMLPGMVEYANRNFRKNEINRGQSFAVMTIGLGSLISGTLGGMLIDAAGIKMMGLVFTIISLCSATGYIITLNRISKD